MARPPLIACVLKRSDRFDYDYVDHLADGVRRHLTDFELVVIEDSPWSTWWAKLSLFDPKITGDLLYFDLDTLIVGDITPLLIGKLTVLEDFNLPRPKFMATGIMYLPEADREEVWKDWITNPELHMHKHRGNGDGGYLSKFYKFRAARWQEELPGKIVSYKVHCKKGLKTPDARVICFHGKPRLRDLNWTV